ncbi:Phosphoribosylformylglycinamidine synthase, PurS subunit [hydrothermal vent metagenome]|uniref:Phosphoribosylformylglycinamidine synthase, PurS subunit n=1 Tax=hydrothermal vent metagenome TaxID=652676 RepID=A0A3B0S1F6_9ZZZZ
MKFRITIERKPGLADPEGKATIRSLHDLGYADVQHVSFGKAIVVDIDSTDEAAALDEVDAMCQRLLANPVMESYRIERIG